MKKKKKRKRNENKTNFRLERKRRGGPIDGSKPFLRFPPRRFVTPPHLLCFSRFASVSPRFFIPLFARAFRHLTPVVSRHHRGCPTATKGPLLPAKMLKVCENSPSPSPETGDRETRPLPPSCSFGTFRHSSPAALRLPILIPQNNADPCRLNTIAALVSFGLKRAHRAVSGEALI